MIRFGDVEPTLREPETKSKPVETKSKRPETKSNERGGKRVGAGRKPDGRPWEAAGMSRAAWYRQKGKA